MYLGSHREWNCQLIEHEGEWSREWMEDWDAYGGAFDLPVEADVSHGSRMHGALGLTDAVRTDADRETWSGCQ